MNEFMISFLNTESALDRMQRVESEIRSEKEETSRIRSGFHSEFAGKERILRNLRTQIDNLGDLCDSARTFHTSLGTIIRLYTAMEENLLGQFEIPADGTSARSGTSAEDAESASERTENTERTESTAPKEEPKDMFSNVEIVPFAILGPNRRKDRKDEEKQADSSEKGESAEVSADNGGAPDTKDQPPINGPGLEDLEPAVNPFFPQLIPPDDSKVKTWEDFIALLPAGLLEKLPEEAVEYLRQLFEFFKSKEMPFGQVRFPGWDEIVTNSMWAAFLAAIMWYFYQNGVIPSPAAEDGKRLPEDGKEPEAKAEEEEEKEEQEEKKLSEDEEAAQEEKEPETNEKEAAQEEKEPEADNKETAAEEKEPETNEKEAAREEKEPAADKKEAAAKEKEPAADKKETAATEKEPKADKKEASAIDKESGKSAERESGKTGGKDTEGTDKLLSDESKVKTMPASTDTLEKVKGTDSAAGKTDPVQAAKKEAEAYVAAARENAQAGASAAGAKGQGTGAASSGGRSTAGGSSGIGKSASGGSSGGGSHGGSGSGQGFSGSNDSPSSLYDDAVSVSSPVDETPASGLSAGADAAGTDAVSEYLSSLLSGQKEMTNELSEWTKTNLRNWGRKAAQKLSSASATFTSPNPVKTVAESVVRAAVVDVGIELAAHGAGAVSAISGGKKDIFEELNEKEEDAVPG